MNPLLLQETVRRALEEDLGRGDATALAVAAPEDRAEAEIISRSSGVLAGLEVAALAFSLLDPEAALEPMTPEGGRLSPGRRLARVRARARALLGAERTALNFLQRLSGVASAAARAVEAVKPHPVMVVDTRKTTPGLRMLEKYAVRAGGACNHRFGLDDAVLIKENHLRLAGGAARAVELVRRRVGPLVKIEVEAENLDQVREALAAGVEIIMLDNMPLDEMSRAVSLAAGRVLLEASGNIGLDDLARTAAVGVDFISLGWITHSAPALDFSLILT